MNKKDFYNKNGFIVEKGLIPTKLIDKALSQINELLKLQLSELNINGSDSAPDNLIALFNNNIDRYKKVVGSLWRSLDITKLMHDQKIINYVKEVFGFNNILLSGGQVMHIQSKSLKIPDGYFGFETHQDYKLVQGSLDGIIIWIPFTDINEDNYPLKIIPKSHINGLYPIISADTEPAKIDSLSYNENDFKSVIVKKGDVVFMSYFTLHRSGTKGSENNVRISVSTRYDNADENTFVKRGFPTAYERNVHRNLFEESFPSDEEIKNIFT